MKKINRFFMLLASLLLVVGCQEDNTTFGALEAPTNLKVTVDILGKTTAFPNGDGSGKIKITSTADKAISYKFIFSDGTSLNAPSGVFEKRFTNPGINTYTITVIASGTGGISTNTTIDVTVFSNFQDAEAVQFLTAGTSKKWYIAAAEAGHFGVGPNVPNTDATFGAKNYFPDWYATKAFEKASTCFYDNVMTFSLSGEILKFQLDNGGNTFFNKNFLSVAGGSGPDDICLPYVTTGLKTVTLSPSESYVSKNPDSKTQTRGTMLNIQGGGFIGYYIGQSSYEILSITENRMYVRAVSTANPMEAWYLVLTTTKPSQAPAVVDYTNLLFADEFNIDGAPSAANWDYDLGGGGWGNSEAQEYTNSANNIKVLGGSLFITAKKEGSIYTSARIKSNGKFDFKYGKIEFKAKMPVGAGTWPAIWSLGSDYKTNAWPACGEIDYMEHRGSTPNVIHGSLHYPGHSGGNASTSTTTITNASSAFHIYKCIWSASSVTFYVDDKLYYTFANDATVPFNKNFFLILNVAMGGNFGGTIDPAFTQSAMEVDYIRVYN